jgi:hypothetical protein
MGAGGSDIGPLFTWLSAAPEWVQALVIVLVALLAGLLFLRLPDLVRALPAIADAVARVRGKGETDRERELVRQVVELQARVSTLEATIRNLVDHYEEWDRVTGSLLPADDECIVPGCGMAQAVAKIRRVRDTREPLPSVVAA